MIETMPFPATASDRAAIEKYRRATEMLHGEFHMVRLLRAVPECRGQRRSRGQIHGREPTLLSMRYAGQSRTSAALADLLARREQLLRPLADVLRRRHHRQ